MNSIDAYIKNLSAGEAGGIAFLFFIVIVLILLFIVWLESLGNGR